MVMANENTYEDFRLQRLEENKRRMEDLNLTHLALSLKNSSSKSSLVKQAKPRMIQRKFEFVQVRVRVRRSSRFTNNPTPVYKQVKVPVVEFERLNRSYKPRDLSYAVASEEARANAIGKAEELESTLGNEFPTFVKPMLHSYVNRGCWLSLPCQFCKRNLPRGDAKITLVDENGKEYKMNYRGGKKGATGLGGGWREFAVDHNLLHGDAVVFQIIEPTKFKVYIIRANCSEGDDGAMDVGEK